MSSEHKRVRIGYALLPKKERSFLQPSLIRQAESKGIDLIAIDLCSPLSQQGPFDAILHKLSDYNTSWKQGLLAYSAENPNVIIVDPPACIERLCNRISMLQAVGELDVPEDCNFTVGTPKQCILNGTGSRNIESLRFPVIAKPLLVDGSANSHEMSLVYNAESLHKLKPSVVVQEFINHGGVIFKVYVVGEHVECVCRPSLPDVHAEQLDNVKGPLSFCQISNSASTTMDLGDVELLPSKFVMHVASGLRKALDLRLFNFDVIRDAKVVNHFYIIDINYFPGYAKMPAYETVFTDFFVSLGNAEVLNA